MLRVERRSSSAFTPVSGCHFLADARNDAGSRAGPSAAKDGTKDGAQHGTLRVGIARRGLARNARIIFERYK